MSDGMRFGCYHSERCHSKTGSKLSTGTQFTHIRTPSGERVILRVSDYGVSTR